MSNALWRYKAKKFIKNCDKTEMFLIVFGLPTVFILVPIGIFLFGRLDEDIDDKMIAFFLSLLVNAMVLLFTSIVVSTFWTALSFTLIFNFTWVMIVTLLSFIHENIKDMKLSEAETRDFKLKKIL